MNPIGIIHVPVETAKEHRIKKETHATSVTIFSQELLMKYNKI